ncbi:DUF342 domain-containing protein [Desulfobaculum bizertense]|uniref:DUF342 domain-containing protein n=1 Tax=Desulfobaculum bizertense DSM 18034 TaxID=1121442 RepID=A0A1T4VZM3_9BACT|nr:FapA family protein [Desulfobaculum bizertense]SKA69921.1 hypothetical protein SAMN02745702_01242 [Desulfobaculum bizertense DSM 18034]
MSYYLVHHFDPDFDYENLLPRERVDGNVDYYNLGYVQNVREGELLAEWREEKPEDTTPWVFECASRDFPSGENTRIDPNDGNRLLASANGYVFYLDGYITIKKTLNVRRDIDFHTGNIFFLGNVIVHGSVRTGFSVRGVNVMARDVIEGAKVHASDSVLAEAGIKGAHKALVRAEGNIRAAFAENTQILAGKSTLIDGSLMHSEVFAGKQLVVKDMLVGGRAISSRYIYVEGQLGGGLSTETTLILGYDAVLMYKAHLLGEHIRELNARLEEYTLALRHHSTLKDEFEPKILRTEKKLGACRHKMRELWDGMEKVQDLESCRVVVPGAVRPGVEITIGEARLKVTDYLENVCFRYQDYDIVVDSPAVSHEG